ncbi:biotin transporter BioY [Halorientalis sp. IM1011]|uniref:biotin transporter BioY n=1 Tax=Halorientalis sp. IM1011 TaxID=1932360 RepID=UPI00097CD65E|nr:biotin transporter BioY [Halorientalis sp. IM1011]AQL42753.1 biotin transporter BioY [Halorientalis sp. IM1011]
MSTDTEDVDLVEPAVVENLGRVALFAALMGAFAYVSFPNPISPAPVTLQVLGVFLAGIFLGPIWGGASIGLYLVAGALGAPVFSGGSAGLAQLVGQTAGYLWGYPVAAVVVGLLVHGGLSVRDPREVGVVRLVGSMVAGTAVVYALGIAGLMLVLGLGPVAAFTAGAAAFIPAEAFKIAAAVGIVRSDAFVPE